MDFEPKSLEELGDQGILKYWPKLLPPVYHKTSEITLEYNCVAWAVGINNEVIDFSVDEEGDPVTDPYYLTCYPYIEYFETHGFALCNNPSLEEEFEKIAIYEKDEEFKHVARQLPNGHWTSKLGEYEDIEHYTLEAVEGHAYKIISYGKPSIYMKRQKQ